MELWGWQEILRSEFWVDFFWVFHIHAQCRPILKSGSPDSELMLKIWMRVNGCWSTAPENLFLALVEKGRMQETSSPGVRFYKSNKEAI